MISKFQIFILFLSLVDLGATYLYLTTFHAKFPQLDHTKLEANPILRIAIQNFGIAKGMIFGGIIAFAIMFLLVLSAPEKWQYFLAGVLSIMCIYHILNFSQLAALKPVGG